MIIAIEKEITVLQVEQEVVITTTENQVQVVEAMDTLVIYQGGVPDISAVTKVYEAGENISSGRLLEVRSGLVYYHDPNGTKEPYGIANNAALMGDNVIVTVSGDVTISGWGLTLETVYYARDNGAIATTPNSTTRAQTIGFSVATNTLNVNIQQPINY
jgi:hypothetical protein